MSANNPGVIYDALEKEIVDLQNRIKELENK